VPTDFAKTVKERFDAPMHYAIIFGYDAMYAMAKAIETAQSVKPEKIQAALKAIDIKGLAGPIKFYDFDGYKNQGKATPVLIEWVSGERKPI
jgi:branched-chain amino acid transport system substrate-binding protein